LYHGVSVIFFVHQRVKWNFAFSFAVDEEKSWRTVRFY